MSCDTKVVLLITHVILHIFGLSIFIGEVVKYPTSYIKAGVISAKKPPFHMGLLYIFQMTSPL